MRRSPLQQRTELQRRTPLRQGSKGLTTRSELRRVAELAPISRRRLEAIDGGELPAKRRQRTLREGKGMATTPMQQAKVRGLACIVCAGEPCDPAHLLSRSVCPEGRDDLRAVVPLCRRCHTLYDDGKLSLLEHLEPYWRTELAFAVERFGLLATLELVTNERWTPVTPLAPGPGEAA